MDVSCINVYVQYAREICQVSNKLRVDIPDSVPVLLNTIVLQTALKLSLVSFCSELSTDA